jgi:hypothetical protein
MTREPRTVRDARDTYCSRSPSAQPRARRSSRSYHSQRSLDALDAEQHTPCTTPIGGGDTSAAKVDAPPWRRRNAPAVAADEASAAKAREDIAYHSILGRDAKRAADAKERRKTATAAAKATAANAASTNPDAGAGRPRIIGKRNASAIVRATVKARAKAAASAPRPATKKVVSTDAKPLKVNLTSMLTKKCVANYEGRREAFGCKARDIAIGMCKSKSSPEGTAIATKRRARELAVAYFDDHFGP